MIQHMVVVCLCGLSLYKNQRDLHMFQQNSYRPERYMKWRKAQEKIHGYDVALLYAIILLLTQLYVTYQPAKMTLMVLGYLFIAVSALGVNLRIAASPEKKKLVYTSRVKRMNATLLILYACLIAISLLLPFAVGIVFAGATASFSYAVMLKANWLNKPIETHINHNFISDAKNRLKANPNLIVIGVTGSYGKTSVKNILYQLLSQKYNVLMTPESYNTLLGVTRTIRERLLPTHEIFIVEMGAKQPGDIKEICDLVNPSIGIITSIGPQHLDTFKSMAAIKTTKGELFEGVKSGGSIYINVNDEHIMSLPRRQDVDVTYFGLDEKHALRSEHPGYFATAIYLDNKGTHFTCKTNDGQSEEMATKLLGAHNIGNMIGGIAIACDLDIKLRRLNTLLYDIEPVEHRLSYRTTGLNYTIIDDAFNANPVGSKNAVEVLGQMAGNKKIIITPGMIELGEKQYELNKAFGKAIAGVCDYTILVGPKQTQPIQDGLREAGYPEAHLNVAQNLKAAFVILNQIVEEGDVVLLENDLPDAYNE
ncbi:MAG: UDP-N-acetylmuramoyl-tripeptide--D-alanyl-D-alanine ligase [Clostridia bacterium]|nr:UDP-N-acetylmuramoyl-tripeptide--D-alanyl-D-alanine ligase [Clostridia bacterium]